MPITFQIKGLKRTKKFFLKLPKSLQQEIMLSAEEFMRFVQKSAKLRAPRLTGQLAESISLKKRGNKEIVITVESPYGRFQEEGFTPHWISSDMPDRVGGIVGPLYGVFPPQKSLFFVAKHTPFIKPALESGLSNLPSRISQATKKAIRRSK